MPLSTAQIAAQLAPHHHELSADLTVRGLFVFGSVARGTAGADSDLDVLVDFAGPANLDRYTRLHDRLEALLGMKIDLVTRKALRPMLRDQIEAEAVRVA